MECDGITQTSEIETNIEVSIQNFTVLSEENIDIKVDLEFIVNMNNPKSVNVIEEIEADGEEEIQEGEEYLEGNEEYVENGDNEEEVINEGEDDEEEGQYEDDVIEENGQE